MVSRKLVLATGCIAAGGFIYLVYTWHRYKKLEQSGIIDNQCLEREVVVVSTSEEWEKEYAHLKHHLADYKVLGFDCEWVTRGRSVQPVALVQLAAPQSACLLVRVYHMKQIPDSLVQLLADPSVLKVGIACVEDAKKLGRDYGLQVRGCVDLRNLAVRARILAPGVNMGLKAMAEKLLGAQLDKGHKVRCSNWEAPVLGHDQVKYAALDAVAGVEIFMQLIGIKTSRQMNRGAASSGHSWSHVLSMCQGIVDVRFNNRLGGSSDKSPGQGHLKKNASQIRPKTISRAYSARKQPLYYNCQLQAPDGQPLCTCDLKKALWYIDKGLGEKVQEDPLIVRLTFEPSGRPMNEQNYYLQEKENICVVCGQTDSYIRKNVVPHEYRKYFPALMKDHLSHDVLLLCLPCHQQASIADSQLKQRLASQCNAPLNNDIKFSQDPELNKVRSAAKALYLNRATIPAWRVEELEGFIRSHFGVTDITLDLLEEAMNTDPKKYNPGYVSHGEKVVRYMVEHEGLAVFEKMWRSHFLESMQPQFLPKHWSVDHNHDRLSQESHFIETANMGLAQNSTGR